MATDIMATSTTKLTLFHSIRLTRFIRFALASLKLRTILLRSAQIIVLLGQYKNKSWKRKLWEIVITLTFLRPLVDAYRVSTNQEDDELVVDQLAELCFTKAGEMGFESIPGCVLQCYVYLVNKEQAGSFALLSIATSCMTTGFASAMISFDMDVDVTRRKTQPRFYGYIPGEQICFK